MWRIQADAERSRNLLYKIAKEKNITFARLIEGLEGLLDKKTPQSELLDQLLGQMFPEQSAPTELVEEMVARKPKKVECIKISNTGPKTAQDLIDAMAQSRKAFDEHAQAQVDAKLGKAAQ